MPDIDAISLDELFILKAEIATFLDSYQFSERAYCEGWEDYSEHRADAERDFAKLRSHLRGLAIDWGIHADFLREYSELGFSYKVKVSAEKFAALKSSDLAS